MATSVQDVLDALTKLDASVSAENDRSMKKVADFEARIADLKTNATTPEIVAQIAAIQAKIDSENPTSPVVLPTAPPTPAPGA
jgi:hypothetical protein